MSHDRKLFLFVSVAFLINGPLWTIAPAVAQEGLVSAVTHASTEPIRTGSARKLAVEARIRAMLDEPTTDDFIDTPLEDVLSYLEDLHEIEIKIDLRALDDLGVSSGTPINQSLHGTSLRSALSLMLSSLDLTYLIEDEVLLITSIEEAETHLQTVVYPVRDLIAAAGDQGPSIEGLIEMIRSLVGPAGWPEQGGIFDAFGNHLVIQQTQAAHEEIESLLAALRQAASSAK